MAHEDQMNAPRLTREPRDPEEKTTRAIVINSSLAWTILCGLLALGAFLVKIGWMGASTMASVQQMQAEQAIRIAGLEQTFAQRRIDRDKQIEQEVQIRAATDSALTSRIDSLDTRMRPLETASASLAFIRDQIVSGFAEVGRRLDRIEGRNDQ